MRKIAKKILILLLVAAFSASMAPAAMAYTAPVSTVKAGLYYGSSALSAANLQNVDGYGSGYEFGYFDSNRKFVSFGSTSTNKITMLVDKNMYTPANSGSYMEGTNGSIVVGCYHLKLETAYPSFSAAKTAASTFTSVNAFPRYENGSFYVCVGSYTSREAAEAGAAALTIQQGYTIDAGSSYTVTVVETTTGKILFEYDCGTSSSLAIRPKASGNTKTQTWFKGYKYYGAFQYARINGGKLTVTNFVNIEDYIKGVIPYEMSASWPVEALKAQAITARTYTMSHINAHRSNGFDLCNTTCCQVYRGTNSANSNSDSAVTGTAGQYLMYNDSLCETYYYSSNGGASENCENVWSAKLPYLVGVKDPYEADIANSVSNYYWTITYTGDQLASRLRNKGYSCSTIVSFVVSKYTPSGNVLEVKLTDINGKVITISKGNTRTVIGAKSQRYTVADISQGSGGAGTGGAATDNIYVNSSTGLLGGSLSSSYGVGSSGIGALGSGDVYAITGSGSVEKIETQSSGNTNDTVPPSERVFKITGSGSGHNVGMSQWGAYSMAKYHNKTCKDILTFYYQGSEVVTAR